MTALVILLMLIFSKFFYLASITSYYTFYLIHTFGVSVQNAQVHLFFFLGAVAVGTLVGGPLGDRFGRKYVIWFSILGMLPFTLMLPYANLFWTGILSVIIGLMVASAFPAIVVYAQELLPGRVGMISGMFFGFAFGMGGIGAARVGRAGGCHLHHLSSIRCVPSCQRSDCLTVFLPSFKVKKMTIERVSHGVTRWRCRPRFLRWWTRPIPTIPSPASSCLSLEELNTLPQELADPIGDDAHTPVAGIVHRHPDRVLLKAVAACPVYCRFCFRREMIGPGKDNALSTE